MYMSELIRTTAGDTTNTPPSVTVSATGLNNLRVGQPVSGANITYTLTNAIYASASTLEVGHFAIRDLPPGLSRGTVVRTSDTVVTVNITGTPTTANPNSHTITTTTNLPGGVFQNAPKQIHVTENIVLSAPAVAPAAAPAPIITAALDMSGNFTVGEFWACNITYTIENGTFVNLGSAGFRSEHFRTGNLPPGLNVAYYAVVNNDTTVMIMIQGTLSSLITAPQTITISSSIPASQVVGATAPVPVRGTVIFKPSGAFVSGSPTMQSRTRNSITVNALTIPNNPGNQKVEYTIRPATATTDPRELATTGWQESRTFNNLDPNTGYYVFARSKPTTTYDAGLIVRSEAISTSP
jgi:hypothetical protein